MYDISPAGLEYDVLTAYFLYYYNNTMVRYHISHHTRPLFLRTTATAKNVRPGVRTLVLLILLRDCYCPLYTVAVVVVVSNIILLSIL